VCGFEAHGVVPGIVTLGKPIGNGHPIAAVVTRPEIVTSLASRAEFFSTFGCNQSIPSTRGTSASASTTKRAI
jgi:4-aminobutyrate aminotransferase-like enzyme